MAKRVRIIREQEVFRKTVFRIEEALLSVEKYDGSMSDEILRLNLDRGECVAALLHNVEKDTVILTEQFRYPTLKAGKGWIVEVAAGMVDDGEQPPDAVMREVEEETGYRPATARQIGTCYMTPGGSSERASLFYCTIDADSRVSDGGGKADEHEDIQVLEMPLDVALKRVSDGEIQDAKTVILLQWLQINRADL